MAYIANINKNLLKASLLISFVTTLLIHTIWVTVYNKILPNPLVFFSVPFLIVTVICYLMLKNEFKQVNNLAFSASIASFFGLVIASLLIYLPQNVVLMSDSFDNSNKWLMIKFIGIVFGFLLMTVISNAISSSSNKKFKKVFLSNLFTVFLFYLALFMSGVMTTLFWGVVFNSII